MLRPTVVNYKDCVGNKKHGQTRINNETLKAVNEREKFFYILFIYI